MLCVQEANILLESSSKFLGLFPKQCIAHNKLHYVLRFSKYVSKFIYSFYFKSHGVPDPNLALSINELVLSFEKLILKSSSSNLSLTKSLFIPHTIIHLNFYFSKMGSFNH